MAAFDRVRRVDDGALVLSPAAAERWGGIAELHATAGAAAARAADLRQAGFLVEIFLSRPIRSQPADAACLGRQPPPLQPAR